MLYVSQVEQRLVFIGKGVANRLLEQRAFCHVIGMCRNTLLNPLVVDTASMGVALTQAKLSGLVDPEHNQVVTLGDHVEGVVAAWEIATKEERLDMLQMMLDAVYIDMTTKEVVGLKPKATFLPLFNLDGLNITRQGKCAGETKSCSRLEL